MLHGTHFNVMTLYTHRTACGGKCNGSPVPSTYSAVLTPQRISLLSPLLGPPYLKHDTGTPVQSAGRPGTAKPGI
jgi:hypothetical protein